MNLIYALENVSKEHEAPVDTALVLGEFGVKTAKIPDDWQLRAYWLKLTLYDGHRVGLAAYFLNDRLIGMFEQLKTTQPPIFTFVSQDTAAYTMQLLLATNPVLLCYGGKVATLLPKGDISDRYQLHNSYELALNQGYYKNSLVSVTTTPAGTDMFEINRDGKGRIVHVRQIEFTLLLKPEAIPHLCEVAANAPAQGHFTHMVCKGQPDGTLSLENDDFAVNVNYCPQCGFKAVTQQPTGALE